MAKKLSDLVIQEDLLHEDLVAGTLDTYMGFTEGGGLVLKEGFDSLKAKNKVLCVFLGLKALKFLGIRETPSAGPTEVSNMSGIPLGTVKVYALELKSDRLLTSRGGTYEVSSHSLNRIADLLKPEE